MDHSPGHHMPSTPDEGRTCSMNMLFTWDHRNLCIIFRWWHVATYPELILSMTAVALLTAGYEYLRLRVRLLDGRGNLNTNSNDDFKFWKAIGYAVQVGYSYFLMLVFMTYNGWIMLSVVIGAFAGYYLWGSGRAERLLSCH